MRSAPERRDHLLRYLKEPIKTYGFSQSKNNEVADFFYPELEGELFSALSLTEELLATGYLEATCARRQGVIIARASRNP